jgi:hypothetical protein
MIKFNIKKDLLNNTDEKDVGEKKNESKKTTINMYE